MLEVAVGVAVAVRVGGHDVPLRVRLIPERDGGGGERDVLGQVQAQRGEPGAADGGVQAAAVLGDAGGLGDGDGADRVRAGQGVAAGELAVQVADLVGLLAGAGALLDLGLGA